MFEKLTTKIKAKLKTYSNIVFIVISLLMLASLSRNIIKVREAKERLKEKEEYIEKIKGENEEDKLGLAKEGETIIVLPDEETIRKFAPSDEKEEEILPDPNWKKWLKLFF